MNMKMMLKKVKNAMAKAGIDKDQVEAAIDSLRPKRRLRVKIPRKAILRIKSLLAEPGDRCIIIRNGKSVRVFTPQGLESLSAVATKNKPWTKSPMTKKGWGKS